MGIIDKQAGQVVGDEAMTKWSSGIAELSRDRRSSAAEIEAQGIDLLEEAVGDSSSGYDAAEYEVQVERVITDYVQATATKRVLPSRYYWAAPFRGTNVATRLRSGELPAKTPFRIAVRPMNAFGGKGEPIYSDSITF